MLPKCESNAYSSSLNANCTSSSNQELGHALLTCHIREANLLSELADARLTLASLEHKVGLESMKKCV